MIDWSCENIKKWHIADIAGFIYSENTHHGKMLSNNKNTKSWNIKQNYASLIKLSEVQIKKSDYGEPQRVIYEAFEHIQRPHKYVIFM